MKLFVIKLATGRYIVKKKRNILMISFLNRYNSNNLFVILINKLYFIFLQDYF